MKVTTPQSVPEGDSSSAGIMLSATAEKKAASPEVRTRKDSGSELAVPDAGAAGFVWARGTAGVRPAATAVLARSRKRRRGSESSAISILLVRHESATANREPANHRIKCARAVRCILEHPP
jgi:hypothetical protein